MLRRSWLLVIGVLCAASAQALTLANIVDLRTAGSSGSANGALFQQIVNEPTGTGNFSPFLRLQNSPIEQAFNTDYRSNGQAPLDAKSDPNYTRSLQLGQLATITHAGVDYYMFTLDIDEPNSGPLKYISLDQFKLYVADVGNLQNLSTATLKWDMDGAGDATVYLNGGNLSSGNGQDDMQVLIPKSNFDGVDPSKYLYLYSMFGATNGFGADNFDANASFEEWKAITGEPLPPPPVPAPGTLSLLVGGLAGLMMSRPRRKK